MLDFKLRSKEVKWLISATVNEIGGWLLASQNQDIIQTVGTKKVVPYQEKERKNSNSKCYTNSFFLFFVIVIELA